MMNTTNSSTRESLLSMYSDVHKDAYNFRPRGWDQIRNLSDTELSKQIDQMIEMAQDSETRESKIEATNELKLQNLVAELKSSQSVTAGTAFRWLMQAEGCQHKDFYDIEHFLWSMGVGCGSRAYNLRLEIESMLRMDGE